jgi:hypothetical protein
MAEPSIELDAHDEHTSSPTYDIAIINGGTVDTDKVFRFGAPDSADGAITAVQRAASGDKWADEFWLEDLSTADIQLQDTTETPSAATQCYPLFKFTSDAVSFASAPILTCYDDSSHVATPTEEALTGTAGHTSTFVKAVGNTTGSQPAQYWGAASDALLHSEETAGSQTIPDFQGLNGDVAYLTCSSTDINTNPQYFSLALSVPDDAALGVDVINIVFSIKYTYT